MTRKLCIFGDGGCAREASLVARRAGIEVEAFLGLRESEPIDGIPVFDESFFRPKRHSAFVAMGNPHTRQAIVKRLMKLPVEVQFPVLIDPDALILHPPSVVIGHGSLVCAKCVLTRDIKLGSWSHANVGTHLGHDLITGDFFTTAYGVNVSGRNCFGNFTFLGAGVSTRDGILIGDDVIVGAGACVVSDLEDPGTYVGVPAKRLERHHG